MYLQHSPKEDRHMPKYIVRTTLTETKTYTIRVEAPHDDAAITAVRFDDLPHANFKTTRVNTCVEIVGKETKP